MVVAPPGRQRDVGTDLRIGRQSLPQVIFDISDVGMEACRICKDSRYNGQAEQDMQRKHVGNT